MTTNGAPLWGIILAGGEGVRLKQFVREHVGSDAPKQFCAFVGRRTMLERTVQRARLLIPSQQLVVSGTAHHRPYLSQSLGNTSPGSVLLQPVNRDTAPGILFPLIHILQAAPRALVAIFPSDHFVLPGRRLMQAVSHAASYLRRTNSDSPILLAAEASYPETEYGWVEPGVSVSSEETRSIFRVKQFAEKPQYHDAITMLRERWLWNTMVLVARGAALQQCFRNATPDLVACFEILQRSIGTHGEQAATDDVYRAIPSLNFSAAVLAHRPDHLLVSPIRQMQWSDWGNRSGLFTPSPLCATLHIPRSPPRRACISQRSAALPARREAPDVTAKGILITAETT